METLFILLKLLYTAYTLACIPIYCKERLEHNWSALLMNEQNVCMDGVEWIPLRLLRQLEHLRC